MKINIEFLNSNLENLGDFYTCSWSVNSSSVNNEVVTEYKTIPPGTYIIYAKAPMMKNELGEEVTNVFGVVDDEKNVLQANDYQEEYAVCRSLGFISMFSYITDTTSTLALASFSNSVINYSLLERGYLRAIRIA